MSEVFQNVESFNDDPDATIFQRYGKPKWYLRILKKPGKDTGLLKTTIKEGIQNAVIE